MDKTLLLVDGSSYLYRAYHAMPNLRNGEGEPTGALYGVVNMLRKLKHEHQAHYAACVFDAPGKTFRDALYPSYKAHRSAMPEDLVAQIAPIHRMVHALGWPLLMIEGIEADDVIGTLADMATKHGLKTLISTGDKDLAQLVNAQVSLINTMTNETLDVAGVVKKFGVPPERIVDYLMLIGDSVDNIPGVDKVGPKTAVKWLTEYGSINKLIEAADSIKGAVGNNLRANIANFPLTRELLSIRCDCDLRAHHTELGQLVPEEADKAVLLALYDRYGFRTWLRELSGDAQRIPTGDGRVMANCAVAATPVDYQIVTTWDSLEAWLAKLEAAPLVALDTETTSLDEMQARLVGFSLACEAGGACYVPVAHRGLNAQTQLPKEAVLQRLRPWLENARAPKLLHNAKYDTHVFANEGIQLTGVTEDTMLQAYVLESHRNVGLTELAQRWLGRDGITYEQLCGKGARQIGFDEVAIDRAGYYAAEDADFTWQLHHVLRPQITRASPEGENLSIPANKGVLGNVPNLQKNSIVAPPSLAFIYQLELEVSAVLATIERTGVYVDAESLMQQSQTLGHEMLQCAQRAHELAGQVFNLNSPKQVGEILFGKMQLPVVRKTAGGAPSTDEDVLSKLAQDYPLPQVLLEYRTLSKLKSTYTDKLPRMINPHSGRVHTHYAQAAVVTGRLASSDPNLQNIPVRTEAGRRVRQAFVAQEGVLLAADYSQIELRIMAHVSEDSNLQQAFAASADIHRATAAEVFGVPLEAVTAEQRRAAKAINFGLIYGMSGFGLAAALGITREAAGAYIDRYFTRYPGVANYMESTRVHAREHGYVETVFGRRLWLPEIQGGSGPRRQAAERAAINAPMQGTAADLIKMAMVNVHHWIQNEALRTRIIMQVHDELVLEVPDEELTHVQQKLPDLMTQVAQLRVPLVIEMGVGKNWEQAH